MTQHSIVTKIANGLQTKFSVSFEDGYLSTDHVTGRVGLEVDETGQPAYRELTWTNDGLVEIDGDTPSAGTEVVFTRTTPVLDPVHDFQDGSVLNAASLDENFTQLRMRLQEVYEQGSDGSVTQDALDDALLIAATLAAASQDSADDAADEAQAAEDEANAAAASALAAAASQSGAASSASGAATSASSAATKAAEAAASATSIGVQNIDLVNMSTTDDPAISYNNGAAGSTSNGFAYFAVNRVGNFAAVTFRIIFDLPVALTIPTDNTVSISFNMEDALTSSGCTLDNIASISFGLSAVRYNGGGQDHTVHSPFLNVSAGGATTMSILDSTEHATTSVTQVEVRGMVNLRVN